MQLMKSEEDNGGEGGGCRVSSITYQFGQRPGLLVAKKGGIFTNETIRPVAFGDHGLDDTV